MAPAVLDHIVVTAPSLEEGRAHVSDALGVDLEPGGQHPRMGTHNLLLRLGDDRYLEVIAVDPASPRPAFPRWFRLDAMQPARSPGLAGWVARTGDIQASSAAVRHALGAIQAMQRDTLEWLITIPGDGSLPLEGIAPMLIQWNSRPHPSRKLQDKGCSLLGLEGFHPQPEKIHRLLYSIGFQEAFPVSRTRPGEAAHLVAHIQTPTGPRRLTTSGVHHG